MDTDKHRSETATKKTGFSLRVRDFSSKNLCSSAVSMFLEKIKLAVAVNRCYIDDKDGWDMNMMMAKLAVASRTRCRAVTPLVAVARLVKPNKAIFYTPWRSLLEQTKPLKPKPTLSHQKIFSPASKHAFPLPLPSATGQGTLKPGEAL